MSDEKMLQEAVNAIAQGQRERARDLLTRLLRANQNNPQYWLWMSAVMDTTSERVYCLQSALKLDPNNQAAKRGLILAGALPPDETIVPKPPPRRSWASEAVSVEKKEQRSGFMGTLLDLWERRTMRPYLIGGGVLAALLFLGVIAGVISALARRAQPVATVQRTITPVAWATNTPSPTPTATKTPLLRLPTATLSAATPLWVFLPQTYTPAPVYVNTPHAIEAYGLAIRAMKRGDYAEMLRFIEQASQSDPSSPDAWYYLGEAHRLLGETSEALKAYNQAISVDDKFAPAYLGRARLQKQLDPDFDMQPDLSHAIDLDPNFQEAYLERAAYWLEIDDLEKAQLDLQSAEELNPNNPRLYTLRSQLALALDNPEAALAEARTAYELDRTFLPAYLALGQAYLANDDTEKALENLHIYTVYVKDDPQALGQVGSLYYQAGQYPEALTLLDEALALNKRYGDAYWTRGLVYLAMDDARKAVTDLSTASQLLSKSFEVNLDFGRALLRAERLTDAVRQLSGCMNLAETDAQRAAVYYWRATAFVAADNLFGAATDWEALLALPEDSMPAEWREEASQKLAALTPTPAESLTPQMTGTPPAKTPTP